MCSTARDGGPTAISPCVLFPFVFVSECVHSREPNSKAMEASLKTIYPPQGLILLSGSPCLPVWQFAFNTKACKSLIWSDFHRFSSHCSTLRMLIAVQITTTQHHFKNRLSLSHVWTSHRVTFILYIPIYVFKQSSSVSGNRLPLWLVCLWSVIYDLVKLLIEQINRCVW